MIEFRFRSQSKPVMQVTPHLTLTPAARRLIRPEQNAGAFFVELFQADLFPDAVRMMALCLEPWSSIWWGCLCVRHTLPADAIPEERAALDAAVRWSREPTAEHGHAALAAAEVSKTSPAGRIARAAFWAGAAPRAGEPPKVEHPKVLSKYVAAGVLLAALRKKPVEATYRQFFLMGVKLSTDLKHPLGGRPT